MKPMTHRGYAARIEYSDEDSCFVGYLAGITDRVGFHGDSVAEIRAAFHAAVDDYLDTRVPSHPPQKPYSGKVLLRLTPEEHARAAMLAAAHGKSLNAYVAELLAKAE